MFVAGGIYFALERTGAFPYVSLSLQDILNLMSTKNVITLGEVIIMIVVGFNVSIFGGFILLDVILNHKNIKTEMFKDE